MAPLFFLAVAAQGNVRLVGKGRQQIQHPACLRPGHFGKEVAPEGPPRRVIAGRPPLYPLTAIQTRDDRTAATKTSFEYSGFQRPHAKFPAGRGLSEARPSGPRRAGRSARFPFDQRGDLAPAGKPIIRHAQLGEDQPAVAGHIENAAAALDERDP